MVATIINSLFKYKCVLFPLILPQLSPAYTFLYSEAPTFLGYVNMIYSLRENRRQEIAEDKGGKARVRSRASHILHSQPRASQMEALRRS